MTALVRCSRYLYSVSVNTNKPLDAKVDLLNTPESITKKIRKVECFPKTVEDNGVILIVESILLPAAVLEGHAEFRVEHRDAEPLVYTSISQLKEDYSQSTTRRLNGRRSPCRPTHLQLCTRR